MYLWFHADNLGLFINFAPPPIPRFIRSSQLKATSQQTEKKKMHEHIDANWKNPKVIEIPPSNSWLCIFYLHLCLQCSKESKQRERIHYASANSICYDKLFLRSYIVTTAASVSLQFGNAQLSRIVTFLDGMHCVLILKCSDLENNTTVANLCCYAS